MGTIFGREPVLYLAVVKAAVVLVVAFGLELEAEQVAAVYVLAEAVLAFVARSRVTPVANPRTAAAIGATSGGGRLGGRDDESGSRRAA